MNPHCLSDALSVSRHGEIEKASFDVVLPSLGKEDVIVNKDCGRCHGKGGREITVKGGRGMWGGRLPDHREWKRCDACGGSGTNPDYRTKSCRNCWNTIEYSARTDSSKVPDLCPSCREKARNEKNREREARQNQPRREERRYDSRPKQDSNWREKSCEGLKGESGCSSRNTIRYRTDWNRIPDLCPDCIAKIKARKAENEAKWREKPCGRPGCIEKVRYMIDWDHPPKICKTCKEKGADLFRRDLIPSGWDVKTGKMFIDQGHITMVFRGHGTNGQDYHVSWDGYGEDAHYTDHGVPKSNPARRHRDPRHEP